MRYLIAQHVSDPFRREPRNVGVFVADGSVVRARFVGENAPGQYDGRKLRALAYPDVYKQWVAHWRSILANTQDPFDALANGRAAHFQVIEGGDISSHTTGTLDDAANYLFALLVSEGGFAEAVGGVTDVDEAASLRELVSDDFGQANILASGEELPALVRYPVRRNGLVTGKAGVAHKASFVQENGRLTVMETVDFAPRNKEAGKDHAGLACYMFDDLRAGSKEGKRPTAIALIRSTPEDEELAAVRYGLSILSKEADIIVNWLDQDARSRFVEQRRLVALGEQSA
jgi:hypothetical protein